LSESAVIAVPDVARTGENTKAPSSTTQLLFPNDQNIKDVFHRSVCYLEAAMTWDSRRKQMRLARSRVVPSPKSELRNAAQTPGHVIEMEIWSARAVSDGSSGPSGGPDNIEMYRDVSRSLGPPILGKSHCSFEKALNSSTENPRHSLLLFPPGPNPPLDSIALSGTLMLMGWSRAPVHSRKHQSSTKSPNSILPSRWLSIFAVNMAVLFCAI
jgi:hypothetical protein